MHCVLADTWEKANHRLGKTADAMEKTKYMDFMPSGRRFKEHRAARWMERMKRIFDHSDGWEIFRYIEISIRKHKGARGRSRSNDARCVVPT